MLLLAVANSISLFDSSGPLIGEASGKIVGLVSFGSGDATCQDGVPRAYTRMTGYFDWIRNEVCVGSVNPPAYFECTGSETRSPTTSPGATGAPTAGTKVTETPTKKPVATPKPTVKKVTTPQPSKAAPTASFK
jgi:secreted trypsin-like serine protease